MSNLSPAIAPVNMLMAQGQSPVDATRSRANIQHTAQAFESSFLSVMLAQMFQGVDAEAPFSGGDGEKMFRSFYTDAIAKQVTRSGGIGLASTIEREMLKMQGLQEELPHGA
jgi:peptidoglycan hydrolase FlgJ